MARIFVSYSRVDLQFVRELYEMLQHMRPQDDIWYDKAPHGLLGGDNWWDQIMQAVADCDIFIYVLTNESVKSKYCQAEFAEARRLQKRIITIQARDRTKLTDELGEIQYVDMKHGVNDAQAVASLSGAINRQLALVKKRARPLWQPQTPKPGDEKVPARPIDAPDVDTPTLQPPKAEQDAPVANKRNTNPTVVGGLFVLAAAIITGVFGLWQGVFVDDDTPTAIVQDATDVGTTPASSGVGVADGTGLVPTETETPTPTSTVDRTAIAQADAEQTRLAATDTPTATDTLTPSPTDTPAPTDTPTPTETPILPTDTMSVDDIAQATFIAAVQQTEAAEQATATARAEINADNTATAEAETQAAVATADVLTEQAEATQNQIQ